MLSLRGEPYPTNLQDEFTQACGGDNRMDFIKEVIDRVDVNSQDSRGALPINWAITVGAPKVLQFLIDKGANKYLDRIDYAILLGKPDAICLAKLTQNLRNRGFERLVAGVSCRT